jgi:hypothetical protein
MMRQGSTPAQACVVGLEDLQTLGGTDGVPIIVNIVAVNATGGVAAASTKVGTEYAYWEDGMSDPVLRPRTIVELGDKGD